MITYIYITYNINSGNNRDLAEKNYTRIQQELYNTCS